MRSPATRISAALTLLLLAGCGAGFDFRAQPRPFVPEDAAWEPRVNAAPAAALCTSPTWGLAASKPAKAVGGKPGEKKDDAERLALKGGYVRQTWNMKDAGGFEADNTGLDIGFVEVQSPWLSLLAKLTKYSLRLEFTPGSMDEQKRLLAATEKDNSWKRAALNASLLVKDGPALEEVVFVEYDSFHFLTGGTAGSDVDLYSSSGVTALAQGDALSLMSRYEEFRVGYYLAPKSKMPSNLGRPPAFAGAGLFYTAMEKPYAQQSGADVRLIEARFSGLGGYVELQYAEYAKSGGLLLEPLVLYTGVRYDAVFAAGSARLPGSVSPIGLKTSYDGSLNRFDILLGATITTDVGKIDLLFEARTYTFGLPGLGTNEDSVGSLTCAFTKTF